MKSCFVILALATWALAQTVEDVCSEETTGVSTMATSTIYTFVAPPISTSSTKSIVVTSSFTSFSTVPSKTSLSSSASTTLPVISPPSLVSTKTSVYVDASGTKTVLLSAYPSTVSAHPQYSPSGTGVFQSNVTASFSSGKTGSISGAATMTFATSSPSQMALSAGSTVTIGPIVLLFTIAIATILF